MLTENRTLIENIKHFRQIINEGVGDSVIVDAINNHKYLYIYYAGDDTILKGYRTVKPFVLGTSTAGNRVLRAWQENGSSDSYAGLTGRKRNDHEYFMTNSGSGEIPANIANNPAAIKAWKQGGSKSKSSMKPGWRLFKVDSITSALPTGKKFSIAEEDIPPLYNPDDKQMTNITASIQVQAKGSTQLTGTDSILEPDVTQQKIDTSFFDKQGDRFKQFFKAGNKTKEATADEIKDLYDVAKRVKKKSPRNLLVVANENGDMVLRDISEKDRLPQESIVGNLNDLYYKLVTSKKPQDDSFLTQGSANAKKEVEQKNASNRTFFK